MAKNKVYQSGDIVEFYSDLYTVHSHTDEKELLGRDSNGELCIIDVKKITKHWTLVEE